MAAEVPLKDIAIAVIGGGAAIAAVLLVFVTFLLARADGLPSETPDTTIQRYERMARVGLVPLLTEIFAVSTAYSWLFNMDSWWLMVLWKWGFAAALATFVLYAVATLFML
jgi:hypothetical protein